MMTFTPVPRIGEGWWSLPTHGVLIAFGFVLAEILARRSAKKKGLDLDTVDNAAIVAVIAGLLGARIAYILAFGRDMGFVQMLKIWEGGLSSHGGWIIGVAAGLLYVKYKKIDVRAFADAVLPYMLIGWAVGRIGCFLNWDSYGSITGSWLSVVVYGEARYPTQLFETVGYLAAFLLLRRLSAGKIFSALRQGSTASAAIFLFALVRFDVDFLRGDDPSYLLFSRIVTVAAMIGAVAFVFWPKRREKIVV
jgi:phosphatidylglycerol:prolipoprotein diacylglycerol transferase